MEYKKMKEVVTYGFEGARLVELVPDHVECDHCGIFVGESEIKMSPFMVNCEHTNNRLNNRSTLTKHNRCIK